MDDKNIEKLKNDYMNIPIPEELDDMVNNTLEMRRIKMKNQKNTKKLLISLTSAAAVFAITVVGVNTSPSIADSLGNVPVIGNVIKVLTFREYKVDEGNYNANIITPGVEGLGDKDLENALNEKYMNENKALYEEFMKDIEELKSSGGGHMGVDSGYKVITDTDEILSIGRYVVNTVASSSTIIKYDTISKKDNLLITLPSLFKDDRYVDIISENIKAQMIERNESDSDNIYWIEGVDDTIEGFNKISSDQSFYISSDNKLVISFDKYEVAPGYMGVVEFTVPTEIIKDALVSDRYIK